MNNKNDLNVDELEQNKSHPPNKSNRKKKAAFPSPSAPVKFFGSDEFTAEDERVDPSIRRIYRVPRKDEEPNQNRKKKKKCVKQWQQSDDEASVEPAMSSTSATMMYDEVVPQSHLVRVGGYDDGASGRALNAPIVDTDTILNDGRSNTNRNDVPGVLTSVDVTAGTQSAEDGAVAEVGAAGTEHLVEVKQQQLSREEHDRKRLQWIVVGIGLLLLAVVIAIHSLVLVDRGNDDVTSPPNSRNPATAAPTSPQEAGWISLIQSRMPSTTFEDSKSPQNRALDWMLGDFYTKSLNEDHRIIQRFALAVLYYSTNGPKSWRSNEWLWSKTECDWGRLDCAASDVVDNLHFFDAGLSGSIPREIGLLSDLTGLIVSYNNVEGTIPSEVGLFTELTLLQLDANNLEGTIPSEVGLLSSLVVLYLFDNENLSGRVPTELTNLSNLKWLIFWDTSISGSIPSNLCHGKLKSAWIDCGEIECDCCYGKGFPC